MQRGEGIKQEREVKKKSEEKKIVKKRGKKIKEVVYMKPREREKFTIQKEKMDEKK